MDIMRMLMMQVSFCIGSLRGISFTCAKYRCGGGSPVPGDHPRGGRVPLTPNPNLGEGGAPAAAARAAAAPAAASTTPTAATTAATTPAAAATAAAATLAADAAPATAAATPAAASPAAAAGAARAFAGGVRDLNHRRLHFLEELDALQASQDALPPRAAPVWRDPLASTRLLQRHLAAAVLGLDADEAGVATAGAALDKWQLATLLPFVRRRELLVLAPTGSGKSFICANYVQFFLARHLSGRAADGVAPPVARIILAVRDETQLRDQFTKISTSEVYLRGLGDLAEAAAAAPAPGAARGARPKNKHISIGASRAPGRWPS